jgi:hypothetical protein
MLQELLQSIQHLLVELLQEVQQFVLELIALLTLSGNTGTVVRWDLQLMRLQQQELLLLILQHL